MRLRVLGQVEFQGSDGAQVSVGGRRQELLLALLCAEANRMVPATRLVELLWPEDGPRDPVAALHNQVWRLRRTLAPAGLEVLRRAPGYALRVEPQDLDALTFEAMVSDTPVDGCGPAALRDLLATALALWRGEPYLGLHDVPVLRHESGRLTEVKLSWLERVAGNLIDAGDPAAASSYLHRAVAEAPLRERTRVLLLGALAADGRTAEAMAQYHAYRTRLTEATGLDPGPDIQTAYRRLLGGDSARAVGGPVEQSHARGLALTPVPQPVAPMVGREGAVEQLVELIGRGHRLVTLTGPGGVGKTRLAVELAHRKWDGEAVFVDLSVVAVPEDVPDAFARACGVSLAEDDPVVDLAAAVGGRELLVVVDNFEQVLPSAGLVASLLSRCQGLVAVVTSRERLALPGETEYPVRPLAVPDPDAGPNDVVAAAAVALFLERVPDPSIRAGDDARVLTRIGQLCRQLGGLPLAIELAAALARYRSIDEVFGSLVRSLGEPDAGVGAPGPLESAIRWSYERLRPAQQHLLRRLCVFQEWFDVDAAGAVAGGDRANLEAALDRLITLGLLQVHRARAGVRYCVPRILSACLQQQPADPAERAAAEAAHFHHYAGQCRGPRFLDGELLARIDGGYPDFLAALQRGMAHPAGDGEVYDLAIAMVLYWLWSDRPRLALHWLDRIAVRFAGSPAELARADVLHAMFLRNLGRADEAAHLAIRSTAPLAAAEDAEWLLTSYATLAAVADDRGDAGEVVRCAEAGVHAARTGVPRRLAEALGYLAYAYVVAGNPSRAAEVALEALALLDDIDSPVLRAAARVNASQALIEAGHGVIAREVLASGLPELRDTPDGIPGYHIHLGWAYVATDDHAGALRRFRTFLDQPASTDQRRWVAEAVAGSACALLAGGHIREAALTLGGAERLMERLDLRPSPWIRRRLDSAYAAIARQPHGSDLVHAGAQLTTDAVIQVVSAG